MPHTVSQLVLSRGPLASLFKVYWGWCQQQLLSMETANNSGSIFQKWCWALCGLLLMRWKPRLELGILLPYWHRSLSCSHLLSYDPLAAQVTVHLHIAYSLLGWGGACLVAQTVKSLPAVWETWVQSLSQEDPLKKEMATHSSVPAWKIPWTKETGRLQSIALQRVRHYEATSLSFPLLSGDHKNVRSTIFSLSYLLYNYAESSGFSSDSAIMQILDSQNHPTLT